MGNPIRLRGIEAEANTARSSVIDCCEPNGQMVDRQAFSPSDFVSRPFPGDHWRARDNFILACLVRAFQSQYNEPMDWEKVCETLVGRTDTVFKPGYMNALACEMQYGLLESYVIQLHLKANKSLSTRAEVAEFISDVFYMKFCSQEKQSLESVVATYGVWQDVKAAVLDSSLPAEDGLAWGERALSIVREVTRHVCPCPPILVGQYSQTSHVDAEFEKPTDESVVLGLVAAGNQEASQSGSSAGNRASSRSQRPTSADSARMAKCLLRLLDIAYEHRDYSIFLRRVCGIEEYDKLVCRPTCLMDVKRAIRQGKIRSIEALRRKLLQMLNNAFVFNSVYDALYQRVAVMASEVMDAFDERVRIMKSD
uniref:Bromo domain-containing protein n=1 Tax=Trichuris muris TaxID=70415 RepID=A0A5S6QRA5_TRIMR